MEALDTSGSLVLPSACGTLVQGWEEGQVLELTINLFKSAKGHLEGAGISPPDGTGAAVVPQAQRSFLAGY